MTRAPLTPFSLPGGRGDDSETRTEVVKTTKREELDAKSARTSLVKVSPSSAERRIALISRLQLLILSGRVRDLFIGLTSNVFFTRAQI